MVYIRWGSSSCPNTSGTTPVYNGTVAGAQYHHCGGGANHLCMPNKPEYSLPYRSGVQGYSLLYEAEYEFPIHGSSHNHNIPCAVCLATTCEVALMIPGKTSCPPSGSWTEEYEGYIMTEKTTIDHHRSTYECVDKSQEPVPYSQSNTNGALFYHVETSVPFGPHYNSQKEFTCVLCTK